MKTAVIEFLGKWRDEFVTTGSEGVLIGLNAAVSIITARLLLPEGKGELTTVLLWPNLFRGLGSFGLDHALLYYTGNYEGDHGQIVGTTLAIALGQGAIVGAAGYFLLPEIISQYDDRVVEIGRLIFLAVPVMMVNGFLSRIVQGTGDFDTWNGIRLSSKLVYAGGVLILWISDIVSVRFVVYCYLAGIVVSVLLVVSVIFRSIDKVSVRLPLLWKMVRYGGKNFLASLTGEANSRLDQALISAFLSPNQLGLYRIAVSASQTLHVLTKGIQAVLLPRVAGGDGSGNEVIKKSLKVGGILLAVGGTVLGIALPWLIPLFFGAEFEGAVLAGQILVIGSLLFGLKELLYNGVRGQGFPEVPFYGELAGTVVTGIGLYLLLPLLGIEGAAVTSLLAYGTSFVLVFTIFNSTAKEIPADV